jgi:hypothetical protein
MTNEEIKQKIATIEKAITALKKQDDYSPSQLKKLEDGMAKYKSMLDSEDKPSGASIVTPNKDEPTVASKMKVKKTKAKTHKKTKKAKPIEKPQPKTKLKVLKKALETQVQQKDMVRDEPSGASIPTKKKLVIVKDKKQEEHTIETAFGKDIKDAILVLNKERFKIREIKDRKTGKTEQVKHTIEYKNAKTIQNRVNSIFDSAVYDIARTPKDKKEKKDIIEIVNDIRDLHSLWLNEIDIIIANEEQKDLEHIRKLMLSLMKEARKNDVDNKWRNAGGLEEMAKKFKL